MMVTAERTSENIITLNWRLSDPATDENIDAYCNDLGWSDSWDKYGSWRAPAKKAAAEYCKLRTRLLRENGRVSSWTYQGKELALGDVNNYAINYYSGIRCQVELLCLQDYFKDR